MNVWGMGHGLLVNWLLITKKLKKFPRNNMKIMKKEGINMPAYLNKAGYTAIQSRTAGQEQ